MGDGDGNRGAGRLIASRVSSLQLTTAARLELYFSRLHVAQQILYNSIESWKVKLVNGRFSFDYRLAVQSVMLVRVASLGGCSGGAALMGEMRGKYS